jgi:flavin reductase (DIM6/NTAB) family NADH-FMN oxidoreductase RutF
MRPEAAFHALVAGLEYPMFIVTASAGEERAGCLVGFATQGSIEPPRLLVMLSKANRTFDVAAEASQLVVHFLHAGNRGLAALFGEETGDSVDKFERCAWSTVEGVEAPVISGTRGFVAGPILDRMDGGDHVAHLVGLAVARVDLEAVDQLGFQAVKGFRPGHPA